MTTRVSRFVVLLLFAFITTCTDEPTTPELAPPPPPQRPPALAGPSAAAVVLVGAGSIARCDRTNDEQTALLLDGIAGTVFTAGNNIWATGALTDFQNCYGPSWGRHKDRTRPAAGDLEYQTPGGAGYFQYFGAAAGVAGQGYYSYDLGEWHVVVLNSNISMAVGSAQEAWLKADLAANPRQCTLAYWNLPRFSSRGTAVRAAVKPLWDALYAAGADVVVNAHYRVYERFAPQNPAGAADPALGIRQFTVGTGGHVSQSIGGVRVNSEVRLSGVYGVLKLTLDTGAYFWEFVPIAGQSANESGTGTCHGPPPNQAPTARPGGPYAADATAAFNGSTSSDPDNNLPLTYAWDFGDGTTGTGVAPTKTYAADGSYTVSLVVTDALGNASAPATTTATISNLPPVVNAGADAAVNLGTAFALNATFTDPGGATDAPWSWTIAWGDGATESGATTTLGGPIAASHTFAAFGQYTVRVTVTDKDGGAGSDDAIVTVIDPSATALMVGAGDIAECDRDGDEKTALLLDGIAGTVFLLGDNAYENGTAQEYANCYNPSWGRHKARTKPSAGNHDYNTANATGYYGYFGAAAGDPTKGYYSYDLGPWHVVVLNSGEENSSKTAAGSPQEQWLRADLAAHTQMCTLAYWHHPLWTSVSGRSTNNGIRPLWQALYDLGADLILNGHDHVYQRFAPMRPDGTADAAFGLRQLTVGTGGRELYGLGTNHPNSEVRDNSTTGVLKLTLSATGYTWQFIPVVGGTFTDAGSATCHGRPGGPPPPNQAPTANPGGPYAADATVTFNGAGSSDPDNNLPLTYTWNFGDGTTGSGVSPTRTYTTAGTYTATLVVTDALGLASTLASTSVTIANVAPAVNAGLDATLVLANPFQLTATFTDPGGATDAPWGWTIAWGDGTTQSGSAASPGGISASHTYAAAGPYTVQVSVTDQDGGTGTDQAIVTVLTSPPPNQPPTVSAGPDVDVPLGSPFNLSATFTDPDGATDAPWAWSITWGDGTSASGSTNTLGGPIATSHTYAALGAHTVRVTVTDRNGNAGADERVVTITDPPAAAVLVGAGNIARCDGSSDEQTAVLLDGIAGTVFTSGDNVRASGSLTDFQTCYEPTWGRHRARTRPAPGDLDYLTNGASGYFSYFGAAAGAAGQGYFSYELGAWHIVVLNSGVSMAVGSPQEVWLKADLAANAKPCVLAYWHHPRFSSYATAVRSEVKPLWDALFAAGAEVVVNGHYRVYERFAPQTPDEQRADATGIRQFTVGTGGHGVDAFGTPRPNSEVRAVGTYGVLKLTLRPTSYEWQFVPIAGQTFTDSGYTACH